VEAAWSNRLLNRLHEVFAAGELHDVYIEASFPGANELGLWLLPAAAITGRRRPILFGELGGKRGIPGAREDRCRGK